MRVGLRDNYACGHAIFLNAPFAALAAIAQPETRAGIGAKKCVADTALHLNKSRTHDLREKHGPNGLAPKPPHDDGPK